MGKDKKEMIDNITISTRELIDWENNKMLQDIRRTGQDHFQGHIKNMKIKQTLDGVVLCGSIAKYLNRENITPLTREQVKQAVLLLQQDTGLDFSQAIIRSIEIGTSIILKNPISEYLQCFDYMSNSKYKKFECGSFGIESVSYSTKTGGFSFSCYDKIQEMKDKHKQELIPEIYQDSNVLRLELKITKRQTIRSLFKKDLTPSDLSSKETIAVLINQFSKFYRQIPKSNRAVFLDTSKDVTPSIIEKALAESYRQMNPKEYANNIKLAKDKGCITSKTMERIRAKNKHSNVLSEKNELIIELDEKIRSRGFF